jgi:hypothetical protein
MIQRHKYKVQLARGGRDSRRRATSQSSHLSQAWLQAAAEGDAKRASEAVVGATQVRSAVEPVGDLETRMSSFLLSDRLGVSVSGSHRVQIENSADFGRFFKLDITDVPTPLGPFSSNSVSDPLRMSCEQPGHRRLHSLHFPFIGVLRGYWRSKIIQKKYVP